MHKSINKAIKGFAIKSDIEEKQSIEVDDSLLQSKTYKFKPIEDSYYVTITVYNNKPYSIFINSKDTTHLEALGVLTTLLSMLFQSGADIDKLINACMKMISSGDKGYWGTNWLIKGKKTRYNSIYEEVGSILRHFNTDLNKGRIKSFTDLPKYEEQRVELVRETVNMLDKSKLQFTHICVACGNLSAILLDGCITCVGTDDCNYSKCG